MSAIFFLNELGKPLLARNFKGDVPMSCVDEFPRLLESQAAPCFEHAGVHYVYIRHADIIVLCVSATPLLNVVAILQFLYRIIDAFAVFVENVEVESVIDNFVVLYELLDEVMDFGFVQTTDANLLQDYVTQSSYKLEVSQAITALTDSVSWRPPGIFYKKNELFVDVVETLNAQITTGNKVLSADVHGVVKMRTFLSGMPLLKMGLNNIDSIAGLSYHRASRFVVLNDVHFHQCVDLDKWNDSKKIEFVPPDGTADLLTYRVQLPHTTSLGKRPMFHVDSQIDTKRSRILIKCKLTAQYRKAQQCRFVELLFPVPVDCDSPRSKASMGTVAYAPELQRVVWRIPNFSGGMSAELQAELMLSGMEDPERVQSAPILVKFEMPGSAVSGLHIRFLQIDEPNLKFRALPWVRYHSKSGEFEVKSRAKPAGNGSKPT